MTATDIYHEWLEGLYTLTGTESLEVVEALLQIEDIMPRFLTGREAIAETRKALQYFIDSSAEFIGCGTTRICFADGPDRVVKIAYSDHGAFASLREIENYKNFTHLPEYERFDPEVDYIPTAACRYLNLGFSHIKLLTMERIWEFPKAYDDLPRWVNWVDCGQVGYNSVGELVAYDL